jgi:hypothetical protein
MPPSILNGTLYVIPVLCTAGGSSPCVWNTATTFSPVWCVKEQIFWLAGHPAEQQSKNTRYALPAHAGKNLGHVTMCKKCLLIGLLLNNLQNSFAFTRLPDLAGSAGLLQLVHPALVIITCAVMNTLRDSLHQAMKSRKMTF